MFRFARALFSADASDSGQSTNSDALALAGLTTADPNRMAFVHSALATRTIGATTYQVCAYRSYKQKLVVGRRVYPSGAWSLFHYDGREQIDLGTFGLDLHNTAVVQIDERGYLHFAWNHHNVALNYRRSLEPVATWTGGVTGALSMLGRHEACLTYPMFLRDPASGCLYFMFRDGVSGNGDWMFYQYDVETKSWSAAPGTEPDGLLIRGTHSGGGSPYLNGMPKFSTDWDGRGRGWMHMNWMWRESASGPKANRDLCHACWNGAQWAHIDGTPQPVPITKLNCDVVYAVGPAVDLLNQCDMDLDAEDRPIVAAIHNDRRGSSQLYAVHYERPMWRSCQITCYPRGRWQGFTRPAVVVERELNTAFFICTNENEPDAANTAYQWTSDPGDFSRWKKTLFHSERGYGAYEHTYDRDLWLSRRELAMLVTVTAADGVRVPVKLMSRTLGRSTSDGR